MSETFAGHHFSDAVEVEGHVFPPTIEKASGSTNAFLLGGGGVRGLEIEGKFIKFTAIAVYLEEQALRSLAFKWKGKSSKELIESAEFFRDIVSDPFEKFFQVRFILPLTGKEFSEKVAGNCVAYLKSVGTYMEAERLAIQEFLKAFEKKNFPPGASIFYTQSPNGSLTISFSYTDGDLPGLGEAVIENKQLSEAVLETIIGVQGVSPATKWSLAVRLSKFLCMETPKVET